MISKIEMALLNATNFNKEDIIKLITSLPSSHIEGAIEIVCGIFTSPEIGSVKMMGEKYPFEVSIENINLTEKKVYVKGLKPETKSCRIPFKKHTAEYDELKEKVSKLSSSEASNLLSAFSGNEWEEFATAECRVFTDWISFNSWYALKDVPCKYNDGLYDELKEAIKE